MRKTGTFVFIHYVSGMLLYIINTNQKYVLILDALNAKVMKEASLFEMPGKL